jgi:hypothetical protein
MRMMSTLIRTSLPPSFYELESDCCCCMYYSFVFLNSRAALSQWCIFHRKRARRVVDMWKKQFNIATNDKKISYLYLSNDILQNSKRKGGEYVNEFWRVLPKSLKYLYENGEEGKKVVTRLVSCLCFLSHAMQSSNYVLEWC